MIGKELVKKKVLLDVFGLCEWVESILKILYIKFLRSLKVIFRVVKEVC